MAEPSGDPPAPPPSGEPPAASPSGVRPAVHEEPKRLSFGAAEAAAKARADLAAAAPKGLLRRWWDDPNIKHRIVSMTIGMSVTLAIILFAVLPWTEPAYTNLELKALDLRHYFCPKVVDSSFVAHVDIDDKTNKQLEVFPFPRKNHAYAIMALKELGAKIVVFDVEFKNDGSPSVVEWHDEISIASQGEPDSISEAPSGQAVAAAPVPPEPILAAPQNPPAAPQNPPPNPAAPAVAPPQDPQPPPAPVPVDPAPDPVSGGRRLVNNDMLLQIAINDSNNVFVPFDLSQSNQLEVDIRPHLMQLRGAILKDFKCEEEELLQRHPELGEGVARLLRGNLNSIKDLVLSDYLKETFRREPDVPFETVRGRILLDYDPEYQEGFSKLIEHAYTSARAISTVERRFFLCDAPADLGQTRRSLSMLPPIQRFASTIHGSGFSNFAADIDGTARRIPLYWEIDGIFVPHEQLASSAEFLGVTREDIFIETGRYVELRNVKHPLYPELKTIRIPVDEKGQVVLAWSKGEDEQMRYWPFTHVPFIALVNYWRIHIELERCYMDFEESALRTHELRDLRAQWERLALRSADKRDEIEAAKKAYRLKQESLIKELDDAVVSLGNGIKDTIDQKLQAIQKALADPRTPKNRIKLYEESQARLQKCADAFAEALKIGELKEGTSKLLKEEKNLDKKVKDVDEFDQGVSNWGKIVTLRKKLQEKQDELKARGDEVREKVSGRVCIIGSTSTASGDLLSTPLWASFPGVGLHTTLFNDIVMNRFIHRVDRGWSLLAVFISGLIVSLIVMRMGPIPSGLFTLGYFLLYLTLAALLFIVDGAWIDLNGPALAVFLPYSSITAYRELTEETKKRQVKKMFEHYLAPDVVDEMMKNPEGVQLGGTRMMATVFFSDIAGFTTMSERMEPEDVVTYLNEYFNAAAPILLKYGGYMDKFIGDAIMCIFGVPLARNDHAVAAIMASIEVQEALAALNDKFMSEKKPALRVRIGLATGPMVVGNIGSEQKVNYTVIGDIVNLGARLEGQNKEYKTLILAHYETFEACQDKIVGRELDLIAVKGKKLAVKVYEPIQIRGKPLPIPQEALDLFAQGLALYRQRKFQEAIDVFNKVLDIHLADGPSLTYISRCEYYLEDPPPEDWDGSFHAKSK